MSAESSLETSLVDQVKEIKFEVKGHNRKEEVLLSFSVIMKDGVKILSEICPDIILLVGDRYETFAMAITAYYLNIPVAHIFGGDLSQGGHLDDSVRHSLTKLAHIHFTTNEDSRERVLGLGEEKVVALHYIR